VKLLNGADAGREFRIGYYSRQDGLDCVWLVNEQGKYCQTWDQSGMNTDFEILEVSGETDLFGLDCPPFAPLKG
jgi:hypothetical protein